MAATINTATERRQLAHMAGSGLDRNLNEPGKRAFDQACAQSVHDLIGVLIGGLIR
jgi:hypothetical protein